MKVVVGAVTSDVDETMKLVDEISAEFRTRFNQDPVFRMSDTACAGIHQQKQKLTAAPGCRPVGQSCRFAECSLLVMAA